MKLRLGAQLAAGFAVPDHRAGARGRRRHGGVLTADALDATAPSQAAFDAAIGQLEMALVAVGIATVVVTITIAVFMARRMTRRLARVLDALSSNRARRLPHACPRRWPL